MSTSGIHEQTDHLKCSTHVDYVVVSRLLLLLAPPSDTESYNLNITKLLLVKLFQFVDTLLCNIVVRIVTMATRFRLITTQMRGVPGMPEIPGTPGLRV